MSRVNHRRASGPLAEYAADLPRIGGFPSFSTNPQARGAAAAVTPKNVTAVFSTHTGLTPEQCKPLAPGAERITTHHGTAYGGKFLQYTRIKGTHSLK